MLFEVYVGVVDVCIIKKGEDGAYTIYATINSNVPGRLDRALELRDALNETHVQYGEELKGSSKVVFGTESDIN